MKIIFTRSNNITSWLIRLLTASKWHHCAIAFDGDDCVYEARGAYGVKNTSIDEFKRRGEHHAVTIDLPDEQKAKLWVVSQLGKPYDWSGIFSIFVQRKDWQDPERWYCSEFAAEACKIGGNQIVRDCINGVTPRDLWVRNLKDAEF